MRSMIGLKYVICSYPPELSNWPDIDIIIFFVFLIVYSKQALYWAADVSIPWMEHIAANKRCSNTETLFYVFWTTISGFVGFLLVLLLTNNKSRDANHYFGNIYM